MCNSTSGQQPLPVVPSVWSGGFMGADPNIVPRPREPSQAATCMSASAHNSSKNALDMVLGTEGRACACPAHARPLSCTQPQERSGCVTAFSVSLGQCSTGCSRLAAGHISVSLTSRAAGGEAVSLPGWPMSDCLAGRGGGRHPVHGNTSAGAAASCAPDADLASAPPPTSPAARWHRSGCQLMTDSETSV